MSAQINLYHPRYLKQRDLLALANVVGAAVALLVTLGAFGAWAGRDAAARQAEAAAAEVTLKQVKEQFEAQTKAAAIRKPSPQLAAEVASAEALLARREQIIKLLEGGGMGSTTGFADYLRGFARQVTEGLWLTGFTIGGGGKDMEIRGRLIDGAALPEYIRRLGTEKVFQGRSFAALTLNRPDAPVASASQAQPATPGGAVSPAPTLPPRYVEFVLTPTLENAGSKQ